MIELLPDTLSVARSRAIEPPGPFFREAGAGPGVVCLHANASSSHQWLSLMDVLSDRFHVLAADSFGAGGSPPWPAEGGVSLEDEAALLEPVFERAGEPHAIVGHSYGAAVAMIAALADPRRVRAIAVYEPALFWLLDAQSPPPNEADGIRAALAGAADSLAAGDRLCAAQRFIDFWMGEGSWAGTPDSRRARVAAAVVNIRGWARAAFSNPTPLAAFAALDVPVLCMMGSESPASSRGVARLLAKTLPRVQLVEFPGMGHMGPVTHPAIVNNAVSRFLDIGLR
jgi:pimeloyl-ACP methyl ester carboxylesterase